MNEIKKTSKYLQNFLKISIVPDKDFERKLSTMKYKWIINAREELALKIVIDLLNDLI